MQWLDGSRIDIKQYSGEMLCEKLADEMWAYDIKEWFKCAEFIQTACFLIAFDTELAMEGIWTFLENDLGQYAQTIIQAFRAVGAQKEADTLEAICQYAPPDVRREKFLAGAHEDDTAVEEAVERLAEKLYLYTDFDIWSLLYRYLDEQIALV